MIVLFEWAYINLILWVKNQKRKKKENISRFYKEKEKRKEVKWQKYFTEIIKKYAWKRKQQSNNNDWVKKFVNFILFFISKHNASQSELK